MTEKSKNILIIAVVLIIVALGVILALNRKTPSADIAVPDINHVYTMDDFSSSTMGSEQATKLVDKLNIDYGYLRDNVDYSQYDIWIDIGNIKHALENDAGALEAWQYASTLNPISPIAFSNIANYYKSFAKDYEKADYYYNIVMEKDNIGYYFDYEAYADLYRNYLPENPAKVETIMLLGAGKAAPDRKLEFYRYLYFYFLEKNNQAKVKTYHDLILQTDPGYQF